MGRQPQLTQLSVYLFILCSVSPFNQSSSPSPRHVSPQIAGSKTTMGLRGWLPRLAVMILACGIPPTSGCPSGCRCYSLTVECGSLGLKEVPPGVLSATEVSRPIHIKAVRPAGGARRLTRFPHQWFSLWAASLADPFLLACNDCG